MGTRKTRRLHRGGYIMKRKKSILKSVGKNSRNTSYESKNKSKKSKSKSSRRSRSASSLSKPVNKI